MITFLGIGNLHAGVPVIFALAGYFGERPLQLTFWDPEEERLDLFDHLARKCFQGVKNGHHLRSTTDLDEALAEATTLVVMTQAYAWKKIKRWETLPNLPTLVLTSDAPASNHPQIDWPGHHLEPETVPHQILRWINGEEYVPNEVENFDSGPFGRWLRDL